MAFKFKTYTIRAIYVLIDICCIYLSVFLACYIRQKTIPFQASLSTILFHSQNPFKLVFLFWMVVCILLYYSRGLYQTKREVFEIMEVGRVVNTAVIASLILVVGIYVLKIEDFPRGILLMGTFFIIFFTALWRMAKRRFVEYIVARGYNNMNVIIVGAGKVGCALAGQIKANPSYGLKIVGFLDDFKEGSACENKYRILGKIEQFSLIARREFTDIVFVTIHNDHTVFVDLLEKARLLNVAVRVVPQGYELVSGEFQKYNIGLIPILEYQSIYPFRMQMGKRLFDLIFSFMGCLVLLPVLLLIGLLIKIDSRGPVFYSSNRYGRSGRMFPMLKFRSMVVDADVKLRELKQRNEVDGPIFKMKNDPRITRMGRWLRKYSLDELPQIINVLLGHMSLVGPRPLPIDQIEKEDLKQLKRLEVRPGITGLWQVRGRSDVSFKRLVRWDMWYINNWSFWLDLNILLRTFPVVVKGQGAY